MRVAVSTGRPATRAAISAHGVSNGALGSGSQLLEAVHGQATARPITHPAAPPATVARAASAPARPADAGRG
ncbi:hypothetical protein, partial [Nonomuraea sp. NPDC023979]|uniref:hypothetical protein n=1 Tax=Nonomuraea sp. NPDC023979 TaxID=3154796 RepID=UPI0033FC5607